MCSLHLTFCCTLHVPAEGGPHPEATQLQESEWVPLSKLKAMVDDASLQHKDAALHRFTHRLMSGVLL